MLLLYFSRLLAAWSDRTWQFSGGLILLAIEPDNLQLVAIYGTVNSVSVILFGALIGRWVDRTPRFKAALTFLAVQNVCVAISCSVAAAYFQYKDTVAVYEDIDWLTKEKVLVAVFFITLSNLAYLCSIGSRIVIEKDWMVVLFGKDDDRMAKANSTVRTIDLGCNLLAPILAAQFFSFFSYFATSFIIAAWVTISVIIEVFLLHYIYISNEELSKIKVISSNANEDPPCQAHLGSELNSGGSGRLRCLYKDFISKIESFAGGWVLYMKHPVRDAGLSLAFLYMTVLGFDNITQGYCLLQGVPVSLLGMLVGVSAFFGICGALLFPIIRSKIGLNKCGIIGFSTLVATLSLCVISIWSPGSPFDPFLAEESTVHIEGLSHNTSIHFIGDDHNKTITNTDYNSLEDDQLLNNDAKTTRSMSSVTLLLLGMILARLGLWISDLTVTQIVQQNVQEEERGTIGGIQNGLQSCMELFKYLLVIILPHENTFGILIFLSFLFICLGMLVYIQYYKSSCIKEDEEPLLSNQNT